MGRPYAIEQTVDVMLTYLITGANRGLGLAMAKVALQRGGRVHATVRRLEGADDLRRLGARFWGRLEIHGLRLGVSRDHRALRYRLQAEDEWIDVLINNAGIYIRSPEVAPAESHQGVAAARADTMLRMLEINTVAPLLVTQAVLPRIRDNAAAKIAFLSSGMASIGGKHDEIEYSYSASKAALNMVVRVLSLELQSRGIHVVALNPGWVATDMGTVAAPLDPESVAYELIDVISSLEPTASGSFLDRKGRPVAW